MTATPKAAAIRRARHQLRVIQANRRARMAAHTAAQQLQSRALGFGVCDSIHRTTTSTGRSMPTRSHGYVATLAQCAVAVVAVLLIAAALI